VKDDVNVVIGGEFVTIDFLKSLFCPLEPGERIVVLPLDTRFAELLSRFDFFPSISDARRNGWNRDVPEGVSDLRIGKRKRRLFIYKQSGPLEVPPDGEIAAELDAAEASCREELRGVLVVSGNERSR
jgi:hypothetical protein